jgi:hypothetical protein
MADSIADFEAFKQCMKIQANLDLEAWDVILFQPLKDLVNWWNRQSDKTKQFTTFLGGIGGTAFTRWLARIATITSTTGGVFAAGDVAGLFAEALTAIIVGIALGTFMDIAGRCIAQISVS